MALRTFHFSVRTPEEEVLKKSVISFSVGTQSGPLVAYSNHASLTGSIPFSRLSVREEKGESDYLLRNGILFISLEEKSAKILCYSCEKIEDIAYDTAKGYLQFLEDHLKLGAHLNEFQIKFLKNEKIAMVRQMREMRSEVEQK